MRTIHTGENVTIAGANEVIPTLNPFKVIMVGALPLDLKQVTGGVEAVILNLFEGFKSLPNFQAVHLAFTKELNQKKVIQYAENIKVYFLPFRSPIELIDYMINRKVLDDIIQTENPDLIHIQEITPHLLRFFYHRKENIVVTQHGIMKEEYRYASGVGGKLKCLFKLNVEKYVFPRFSNIIFISKYNQRLFPGKPVNSLQLYNPVNPIFFKSGAVADSITNTMLYVGVLSRRKNIRLVIEALHLLNQRGKNFTLHVAGNFKEKKYEQEILSLVESYQLKSQIIFHGWMKQEDIHKIYDDCPIFILPSLQETLPVSIAEAMALGKIVIASDVGAIREMFTDKKSGFLFERNNLGDLVKVMETVFDRTPDNQIGTNAQIEAREKFHPVLVAEKTRDFYKKVLTSIQEGKRG